MNKKIKTLQRFDKSKKRRKIMKSVKNIPLIILLSLLLSVTGSTSSLSIINPVVTVEAATVKISKTKATMLKGEELKLKISGTKSKIKWSSSRPKIASVTSKGIVRAKKKGTAKITAKVKSRIYSCAISVETPKLNATTLSLTKGSGYQLKVIGSKQKISWRSNNKTVATVNNAGKVTAKNIGNCTIYAVIRKTQYKCKISVKTPSPNNPNETVTPIPEQTPFPEQTPSPNPEPGIIDYVWLSETGKKYHKIPNCGKMNPDKARRISLQDAINRGYPKCNNCF